LTKDEFDYFKIDNVYNDNDKQYPIIDENTSHNLWWGNYEIILKRDLLSGVNLSVI